MYVTMVNMHGLMCFGVSKFESMMCAKPLLYSPLSYNNFIVLSYRYAVNFFKYVLAYS